MSSTGGELTSAVQALLEVAEIHFIEVPVNFTRRCETLLGRLQSAKPSTQRSPASPKKNVPTSAFGERLYHAVTSAEESIEVQEQMMKEVMRDLSDINPAMLQERKNGTNGVPHIPITTDQSVVN